jgi:hypothetical protein
MAPAEVLSFRNRTGVTPARVGVLTLRTAALGRAGGRCPEPGTSAAAILRGEGTRRGSRWNPAPIEGTPGCGTTWIVWARSSVTRESSPSTSSRSTQIGLARSSGVIARGEKFGTEIDAEWAWLIKFRDGRVVEVWMFTDRGQALDAARAE